MSFIGLPYLFFSMFGVPIVELTMLVLAIAYTILGLHRVLLVLLLISFVIELCVSIIAILLEKEDKRLILYSIIYALFYKYLIHVVRFRSYWLVYRGKMDWQTTRSDRYGELTKKIGVTR